MSELQIRTISGAIIVICILGGVYMGDRLWFILSSIIALASLWEYYNLFSRFSHVSKGVGLIVGAVIIYLAFRGQSFLTITVLLVLQSYVTLAIEIFRRTSQGKSSALLNMSGISSGLIFIVFPWSFLVMLRQRPFGGKLLLSLFLCTWSCDVLAYLIGRKFGKTPFARNISPKKTLEGFAGGLVGSLFCAVILSFCLKIPPLPWILMGALVGVGGQIGDLYESLFKREVGVKNSGTLIPGHGGFLDRFDSILINSTLIFLVFEVILS
ncbi:MAG: phosphatidate cytidylyltransferase [Acetomicrobium sp.]